MKEFNTKYWIRISLLNLLIVAIVGGIMRYKIGFYFPWLHQDFLHHAHSHFAFSGWVTQTLFVYIIDLLLKRNTPLKIKRYEQILTANLIVSYAMLISFTIQGYQLFSIIFSTLSIVISIIFTLYYYHDTRKTKFQSRKWFDAALLFSLLSTLGTFSLIYMMISKSLDQHIYLASVYWYLHFQYNGFFFFGCTGLFINYLSTKNHQINDKNVFLTLALTCIPLYILSVLWLNPPLWVYLIAGVAAVLQLTVWIQFIAKIRNLHLFHTSKDTFSFMVFYFGIVSSLIKMLLQTGSSIPSLSHLAFGSRAVIIAYLHLVLLAFISVFLISYGDINKCLCVTNSCKNGIKIFLAGILINEILLAIQGLASFSYTVVPLINESLCIASLIMITGLVVVNYHQQKQPYDLAHL